ncbi:MAG: ACT domain-containing protein [Acidobacteria bacterium]|nr:ACT domain-containing protein [Acidobacteriota bacterium]
MRTGASDPKKLLLTTRVVVAPETYAFVGLADSEWKRLIEDPALSPRMSAPFMIFRDSHEVTLLLDEVDFGTMRHALRSAKVERGFRLLTFDTVMDFSVVGFLATVATILAEAGVSIVALSSFSRDSILVKQDDLANALKALGPHVEELC